MGKVEKDPWDSWGPMERVCDAGVILGSFDDCRIESFLIKHLTKEENLICM